MLNTALLNGVYRVYRPKNPEIGAEAARVAKQWGESRTIKYSVPKAGLSVIHNATPGLGYKRSVANQAYKDALSSRPSWAEDGAYCSELVMRSYVSAVARLQLPVPKQSALHVDPRYVSPKYADHLAKTYPDFELVGRISVRPQDVAYADPA